MSRLIQRNGDLDGVSVEVIETPDLGDRSYVVSAEGAALVVDPQRDIDRVLEVLDRRGLRATHVLETHLHNDYLTGGLELTDRTGAAYVVPGDAVVAYPRTPVFDGDELTAGDMTVRVLATPGHTPHHLAYAVLLDGDARAVFSGGSLLFGSVGRTDLVTPELTDELAHAQWRSARRLAADLPAGTALFPTHGFGSFCSASPTSGGSSTVGEQARINGALLQDEDAFVREMVAGLDSFPAYYAHMGPGNAAGPGPVDLSPAPTVDAVELQRRLDGGEWVVDLRARAAFARGHVPRTLSFDASDNVVTYLGWTIPWGTPVTLLGATPEQVTHVQRELVRIGIDRPAGQAIGGPNEWAGDVPLASYERIDFGGLAGALVRDPAVVVLDVRNRSEWAQSHVDGAVHVPLPELEQRMDELPAGRLHVHCGAGFRAAVAASLLERAGREVVHVDDDYANAVQAGLPVVAAG